MSGNLTTPDRIPLPPLLEKAEELAFAEFRRRLVEEGFDAVRPGHGCVLRFVDVEGSRLTELAERAGLTKQAVGQAADDLERLGYVERIPDPSDGRAKTIRLTTRGAEARAAGRAIFEEIEERWAERYGAERVAALRDLLEEIVTGDRIPALPAG
jgi:DNA-binding MarR family transcriptional regulator